MDILNSLYIGLFGMSVVFAVLIFLILLILLQSYVARKLATWKEKEAQEIEAPAEQAYPAVALATELGEPPELKLTGVDEKTAAIIMAIVCDETGIDPSMLYFKSIRAMDDSPSARLKG